MRTVLGVLGAAVVSEIIAVGIFIKLVSRRRPVSQEEYEVFFFKANEEPVVLTGDFALWDKEYHA